MYKYFQIAYKQGHTGCQMDYSHTFNGGEPAGNYNIGIRFIDSESRDDISVNEESFNFYP